MTDAYIDLGGARLALAPPTIGRLEQLQKTLGEGHGSSIGRTVAILNICLVTPLTDETPARLDELREAMAKALDHAGFKAAVVPLAEAPAETPAAE